MQAKWPLKGFSPAYCLRVNGNITACSQRCLKFLNVAFHSIKQVPGSFIYKEALTQVLLTMAAKQHSSVITTQIFLRKVTFFFFLEQLYVIRKRGICISFQRHTILKFPLEEKHKLKKHMSLLYVFSFLLTLTLAASSTTEAFATAQQEPFSVYITLDSELYKTHEFSKSFFPYNGHQLSNMCDLQSNNKWVILIETD